MLDCLLHKSVASNITGDSYRMRTYQAISKLITNGGESQ